MNFVIVEASMHRDSDGAFLGKTVFEVEGHQAAYEITFFSKRGKEWDYSLNYAQESGIEAQLLQIDAKLEEDDDWFDALLEAAQATLEA